MAARAGAARTASLSGFVISQAIEKTGTFLNTKFCFVRCIT
jgi:hypothetical protein